MIRFLIGNYLTFQKCEEKLIAIFKSTTGIDGRRCHWCVTPILQEPSNSASAVLAEKGGARCNNVQCGQFVCRSCLKQNLTRDQLHAVRVSQEKGEWKCFRCNPQLIRVGVVASGRFLFA